MAKRYLFFLIPALVVIGLVFYFFCFKKEENMKLNRICFKENGSTMLTMNCFEVELAQTAAEWAKGLMFRESLDAGKGMFFIFKNEEIYPFWMKNTLIPLDIIWINENKEIVFIAENVLPCPPAGETGKTEICPSINPNNKTAKYVLEINGGFARKLGLKIGDKAEFDFY